MHGKGRPDRRADDDVPQHLDHLDGRQNPGRQVEHDAHAVPRDGTALDGTARDGTAQDGTAQDSTAQDSTAQGGAARPDLGGPRDMGAPGGPGETGGDPGNAGGPDGQPARRTPAARAGLILAAVGVVVVVAGAAGVAVVANSRARATSHARAAAASRLVNRTGTAAVPVRLVSATPRTGATGVNGATTIQLTFSAPLGATVPNAVITPRLAGQWQVSGRTLTFTPVAPLPPRTTIRVTIPAGSAGVRSATGGLLDHPVRLRLRTAGYSPMRLAELLSQLGYLPVSWQPTAGRRLVGGGAATSGLAAQEAMAYSAPAGRFTWSAGYPALLRSQWGISFADPMIRGAVMAFQSQHGMTINGTVDHALWRKLFAAAAAGRRNTVGYTYAIASKSSPETLTIWHNGHVVLHSLANTGIPVSPTVDGTFPVYLRYRFQIMRGTNPDGSTYADPVSFVSYFNGGDAVHYFLRGSYGFPQSLGCVELPYGAAKQAWPYLTYGSLVTVTG